MEQQVELINVQEAAKILGISTLTLYRYARKNEIPSYKVFNSVKFAKKEIEEFLEKSHKGIYSIQENVPIL